MSDPIPTLE
jgi:hypothetical protein